MKKLFIELVIIVLISLGTIKTDPVPLPPPGPCGPYDPGPDGKCIPPFPG